MDVSRIDFSTDDLPEQDRDAFIRDYYGRIAMRFDLAPLNGQPIGIDARSLVLPDLSVTAARLSAVDAERSGAMRGDGNSDVMIAWPRQAVMLTEAGRDPVVVEPGEMLVAALDRPIRVTCPAPASETLTLQISRAALGSLVRNLDDSLTGRIGPESPTAQLLHSYAAALLGAGPLSPVVDRLAARHIAELAAAALAPGAGRDESMRGGVRAARLLSAKRLIEAHLHQPGLCAELAARKLGVSPRYVRLLFEPEGLGFGAYVTERRLVRARERLCDPSESDRRIIDIAYDLGFGDIRTFNRAFRRRFGRTPSDIRRERSPNG